MPERIGIIGAGQMGRGIAHVAARAGCDVLLVDRDKELAERGYAALAKEVARMVEKGAIQPAESEALLGRVRPSDTVDAFADCTFVIEAATEDVALKTSLFERTSRVLSSGTVFATNTSSISITKLAAVTAHPENVIGMHFMNPVPRMKLVEIIRGLQTSDGVHERTTQLAASFDKTVVTSRDMPGFIVNRLLLPLLNEACFALQEGLGTVEDIDAATKLGLNHPMGPFELADLVGLDTVLAIAEVLHRDLGEDKYRPAPLLRSYVAANWLGRKTGRGFYTYGSR